ncbi:hypothetical protein F2P81_018576 [Scophthalmus maximus]|uniref:Uncharacterized protein n=1 Tax=Scophthalmus maximus TaxID=52904 RepID=A0A6A4SEA7_SCOMX|nr:hypothetical protein F2P81_018576 [Scophthalmus maximus]
MKSIMRTTNAERDARSIKGLKQRLLLGTVALLSVRCGNDEHVVPSLHKNLCPSDRNLSAGSCSLVRTEDVTVVIEIKLKRYQTLDNRYLISTRRALSGLRRHDNS